MTVKWVTPELGEEANELNLHRFKQLETYSVRDLDCGISARIHPDAEEITHSTSQWLRDVGMDTLFDEKTFHGFVKMDCPRVLSMTHPDSPFTGTLWIAKLTTMFFVADDFLDTECGKFAPGSPCWILIEWHMILFWSFPRDSDTMLSNLLGLLKDHPESRELVEDLSTRVLAEAAEHPFGTVYPEKLSPCAAGLRELWQEAIMVMPRKWALRLAFSFHKYFCWHMRESFNRKQKRVPTIDEYMVHRTGTGGMHMLLGPSADYVERNLDISADEVYYSPLAKHLLDFSNLASCLFNDIYSFPKELRNGEYHNMVFVISYWQQCSYNEAVEIVMRMVEDIIRDILDTVEEITRTVSPQDRAALDPTIQACVNSIPAHHVFHKTSSRYSFHREI